MTPLSKQTPSSDSCKGIDIGTVLAASLHEIKNDFALMTNRLENLSLELSDRPKIQNQFLEINHQTGKISSELMRLLALYKLDKSKLLPKLEQVAIDEFFEDKVLKFEDLCTHRKVNIHFECDNTLFSFFDVDLINSVIDTAIHNALRFTNKELLLSAEQVSTNKGSSFLCIHVEDDGPGFPDSMVDNTPLSGEKIKEQSSEHSFSEGNTGLGLFFASQIAQVHSTKKDRNVSPDKTPYRFNNPIRNGGPTEHDGKNGIGVY